MRWRPSRARARGRAASAVRRTGCTSGTSEVSRVTGKRAQAYQKLVARLSPKSDMAQGIFRAYWVGGVICALGQTINDLFTYGLKWGAQSASTATSICLIFASSLLTGLGVYDKIGKYAGAGSIVPITGFANSVVSPAMEFRREGLVMGVGAKLFTLAGPVLTYGIGGSIVVGLVALAMGAGR